MLAHKYNPDKFQYPGYIQPKLDGVRCVFTKNGASSRTGKQFMNVKHIEHALNLCLLGFLTLCLTVNYTTTI